MNILFLKGFNNYFNRTVKKYSDLADYKANCSSYVDYPSINFNPNDGILTELVIGSEGQKENSLPLAWEDNGAPDYCVCYEMQNNSPVIKSRWYILESERTRLGQYHLALKRDVLAEHFDSIMTAPCFVEKGFVNNVNSPFLYNSESMTYNQIKQKETLLKDNTGCGWIIGYVSQDGARYPANDANPNYYSIQARAGNLPSDYDWDDLPQTLKDIINSGESKSVAEFSDFEFECNIGYASASTDRAFVSNHKYTSDNSIVISTKNRVFNKACFIRPTFLSEDTIKFNSSGILASNDSGLRWFINNLTGKSADYLKFIPTDEGTVRTKESSAFATYYETTVGRSPITKQNLDVYKYLYNNKIIHNNGRIYKLVMTEETLEPDSNESVEVKYSDCIDTNKKWIKLIAPTPSDYTIAQKAVQFLQDTSYGPATCFEYADGRNYLTSFPKSNVSSVLVQDDSLGVDTVMFKVKKNSYKSVKITLVPEETMEIRGYIPNGRQQCVDSNIDIFAIPYSDNFEFTFQEKTYQVKSKDLAIQAGVLLGKAGNNVYDIQLLPYFPDQRLVGSKVGDEVAGFIYQESVNLNEFLNDIDFSLIKDSTDKPVIPVFWSRVSKGTFDINNIITSSESLKTATPLGRKLANETEMFRLVSPNYAGQFEFSLSKSGSEVSYFNVDFNYKPINPYIHLTPALSGLYGDKFVKMNDIRGLVCGGDFSITRIISSWEQYQLQNKNYQEIFDRQIKSMDVNNAIAREQQDWMGVVGAITGGIAGATGGAVAGAKINAGIGGAIGAAAGALIGTTAGIVGAAKDKEWLERQQQEARSYAIDMYGYQLGNIQALPYSLAKTSALTENNKIFPFVEEYQATQEEVSNLTNKIKFNGMTIMTVAKLEDYSTSSFDKTFVKGQLIRLEGVDEDFHLIDTLYQEVYKGFYIPQGE